MGRIGKVAAIEPSAEGVVLPSAALARPATVIAELSHLAVCSPVAAAAMGITPVVDGTAVGAPDVATEEDGVGEPVESPTEPAERIGDRVQCNSRAPGESCVDSGADGAKEMESRIGSDRSAIYSPRIVLRHVDDLRRRRCDLDVALVLYDFLLRGGLEITRLLRAIAHNLDCLHHVHWLVVISVSEVGGPRQVLRHLVENLREAGECLYARVPTALCIGSRCDLLRRRPTLRV